MTSGVRTALLGTGSPITVFDDVERPLYARRMHGATSQEPNLQHTIILTVISAFIFILLVAFFEVVRTLIYNRYAVAADIRNGYDPQDIENEMRSRESTSAASACFVLICLLAALIFIPLLAIMLHSGSGNCC